MNDVNLRPRCFVESAWCREGEMKYILLSFRRLSTRGQQSKDTWLQAAHCKWWRKKVLDSNWQILGGEEAVAWPEVKIG